MGLSFALSQLVQSKQFKEGLAGKRAVSTNKPNQESFIFKQAEVARRARDQQRRLSDKPSQPMGATLSNPRAKAPRGRRRPQRTAQKSSKLRLIGPSGTRDGAVGSSGRRSTLSPKTRGAPDIRVAQCQPVVKRPAQFDFCTVTASARRRPSASERVVARGAVCCCPCLRRATPLPPSRR